MARLTVRRGPQSGKIYQLTADQITIGRGTRNDIVIDDNDVSREHCRLIRVGAGYQVEDLDSLQGTFINGQRVQRPRALQPGSMLELGEMVTLQYEGSAIAEDPAAPVADETTVAPGADYHLLVEITGSETSRQVYSLDTDRITIGRDLSNDIVIQDPEVSRRHIQLVRQGDSYTAEDLGSTNGTRLNGHKLTQPGPLTPRDVLSIGASIKLHFLSDTVGDSPTSTGTSVPAFTIDSAPHKLETDEVQVAPIIPIGSKRQTSRLGTGLLQGSLQDHVLLSYAREDWEDVVAPLMIALQDAGIQVWVEQYLTPESDDWQAAIQQAVAECWLLVVVLTPEALDARQVKLEYRYFINREKPVIGFEYRPVAALPPEMEHVGIVRHDPHDSRRSFQRLIFEILQKRD